MDFVLMENQSGVFSITMNRPELHNAFNEQMIQELIQAFEAAEADASCRVVVLQAAGKNFSAGADLNWMKSMAKLNFDQNKADSDELAKLMYRVYSLSKPVIAKVKGASFGGALGLIAACDMAVAVPEAKFCLSEVKIGLVPAVISPYVVEALGVRQSRRYMQTAEVFSADAAKQMGLLNEVVSEAELDSTVQNLAQTVCANSPQAVTTVKQLIDRVAGQPINDELIDHTSSVIAQIRVSEEGQEGLASFLEKRNPSWK